MAVVCKPLPAVCVHCSVVYYIWEKDQDYDFAVLCNINLCYDDITGHEVRLELACNTAVISVTQMLSLRIY